MNKRIIHHACLILFAFAWPALAQFGESSFVVPLEDEAIQYDKIPPNDPVTALLSRIDQGKAKLTSDKETGFLRSLLKELSVPESSQMLVFSKTSAQLRRISPSNPRAIYFNDDVYVGYVRGSDMLEISAVDPKQGAMFYTAIPDDQGVLQFKRDGQCLQCHASPRTAGVPGHIVRSLYADDNGFPLLQAGSSNIDHRSSIESRWGGWYVTGTHKPHHHMGNLLAEDEKYPEKSDLSKGSNITDLSRFFDQRGYLSGHSDIVALMVLEHQTRLHNLLTLVNYEARTALRYQQVLNEMTKDSPDRMLDSTKRRFNSATEALLRYMLFVEEAPLKGVIVGTSTFTADFAKQGPRDRQGRSLRDFDLKTRIFRYPLSYLIYSQSFDQIPDQLREHILRRLWEILTGRDKSEAFATIKQEDRKVILEILRETKKNLPDYWVKNE